MHEAEKSNGMAATYLSYAIILIIAIFQVIFAIEMGPSLVVMMLVASLQASLAVIYFMHLGQERPTLALALIPYTIFVLFMMNMFWSDSYRLLHMRPH
jgi:hypothetical protein